MVDLFLFSLIFTGLFVRLITHKFHVVGKDLKKQKTLTGYFRKNFNFELHHIHFGFLILFITLIYYLFSEDLILFLLGISLSLIVDQWLSLFFKRVCYFSRLGILSSLLGHLMVIFTYILFF